MKSLGLTAAIVLAACASPKKTGTGSIPNDTPSLDVWDEAWDIVTEFGQATAQAGPWKLENAGAIIVSRPAPRGKRMDDATLAQALEQRLARAFPDDPVEVEVAQGIVHLRGGLPSREDAEHAVFVLLSTHGIVEIVSHLSWPGSEPPPPHERVHAPE